MAAGHVVPEHAQHRSPLLVLNVVKEALNLRVTARICMACENLHVGGCTLMLFQVCYQVRQFMHA